MKRILIAGIVGGIVIFFWGAISHMATPIGMMGFSKLADEPAFLSSMKTLSPEKGMYLFPGLDPSKSPTEEDMTAREEKAKSGPSGLLIVNPAGSGSMTPGQLGTELASNILGALIGAYMICRVVGNYPSRVVFMTLLGILGWVSINISYWNWYKFPTSFTVAALLDEGIGWLLAGIVVAWIVPPPRLTREVARNDSGGSEPVKSRPSSQTDREPTP